MSLEFSCRNCGASAVVRHLKKGDEYLCRSCGVRTAVPHSAVEVGDEPQPSAPTAQPEITPVSSGGESTLPLASRGSRLAAAVVDIALLLVVVLFVFLEVMIPWMDDMRVFKDPDYEFFGWLFSSAQINGLLFSLPILAIQWYLLTVRGQSLGKILMDIKIVKTSGEEGGFISNALIRDILNRLMGVFGPYLVVDILFIFRSDRRCIHDLIAGTKVVQLPEPDLRSKTAVSIMQR